MKTKELLKKVIDRLENENKYRQDKVANIDMNVTEYAILITELRQTGLILLELNEIYRKGEE